MSRYRLLACAAALSFAAISSAFAAGDFPLASCKGWNGTVVERSGIDTARAAMRGVVTKADLQEYCERDPNGETTAYGGTLTLDQCVADHLKEERRTKVAAQANCGRGTLSFRDGSGRTRQAKFPLRAGADTSCASGMPPLIAQFKVLCPVAAASMNLE